MQEAFEKIKERLEELKHDNPMVTDNYVLRRHVIEIVNQVAEEYSATEIVRTDRLECEVPSDYFGQIKEVRVIDERTEEEKVFKEVAEEYSECYKDCKQCEAYDKEKHHCPKFCKVIRETVAEIKEDFATDTDVADKDVGNNGWISVSSGKLPEREMPCWIANKWADGSIHTVLDVYTDGGEWFETKSDSVIAWMPINEPEPYRTEGE